MSSGTGEFLLPITKNKIKVIENMEKEFYKTQAEIKEFLTNDNSSNKNSSICKALEKQLRMYKLQVKYYKSLVKSNKAMIRDVTELVQEMDDITSNMVRKSKKKRK